MEINQSKGSFMFEIFVAIKRRTKIKNHQYSLKGGTEIKSNKNLIWNWNSFDAPPPLDNF